MSSRSPTRLHPVDMSRLRPRHRLRLLHLYFLRGLEVPQIAPGATSRWQSCSRVSCKDRNARSGMLVA